MKVDTDRNEVYGQYITASTYEDTYLLAKQVARGLVVMRPTAVGLLKPIDLNKVAELSHLVTIAVNFSRRLKYILIH